MNFSNDILDNIYSYLPNYMRADLKCKFSIKLNVSQYKDLDNELYKCFNKKKKPFQFSCSFNHPVRELIWFSYGRQMQNTTI